MELEKPEWLLQVEGILGTLNEGVLIADDCQNIVFINECFEEMLGVPASEVIGRTAAQFYTQEEYKFLMEQSDERNRTGQNRLSSWCRKRTVAGCRSIISSRSVEDPDGRMFGIVTFTDISDQKRARSAASRCQRAARGTSQGNRRGPGASGARAAKPRAAIARLGRHARRNVPAIPCGRSAAISAW